MKKGWIVSILASSLMVTSLIGKDLVVNPNKGAELKFTWKKSWGGNKRDKAMAVTEMSNGNLALAGYSRSFGKGRNDATVVCVSPKGRTLWYQSFGGKRIDEANAITSTADRHLVIAGVSQSFSKDHDKDFYIVKLKENGDFLWDKTVGGVESDVANGVAPTKDGGVVVVGTTESYGNGNKNLLVVRLGKNGEGIWRKVFGGKEDDVAKAVVATDDGGFVVVGGSQSFGTEQSYNIYMIKIDANGKQMWAKSYGEDRPDVARAITASGDGGFVVAGATESFGSKHKDLNVMRIDAKGNTMWHKIYGFKSKEYANGVAMTPEGGVVVVGTTQSMGHGEYDFYVIELNKKGSLIWSNVYGGPDKDIAHDVISTKRGTFMIVGETESFGSGDFDFYMLELKKR